MFTSTVYCVSFPDTSKVREELKEAYKSKIPPSQKHIQQLLHSDTTPLPTERFLNSQLQNLMQAWVPFSAPKFTEP